MQLPLDPAPGPHLFTDEDSRIDALIDAAKWNRDSLYSHPGFAPVREEHRHAPVRISGTLPADLEGAYLRNGTNVQFDEARTRAHCFNGAGMLHQVQIAGEPERKSRAKRLKDGIPVDATTWKELVDSAGQVGLPQTQIPQG